jgi:hypothetical protein
VPIVGGRRPRLQERFVEILAIVGDDIVDPVLMDLRLQLVERVDKRDTGGAMRWRDFRQLVNLRSDRHTVWQIAKHRLHAQRLGVADVLDNPPDFGHVVLAVLKSRRLDIQAANPHVISFRGIFLVGLLMRHAQDAWDG